MIERRWFIPELDDPADITDGERAFAAALSEATAELVPLRASPLLIPAAYGDLGADTLVASLSLWDRSAGERARSLIDFGVHFRGDGVRGGRLHNQLHFLSDRTPSLSFGVTGSVDVLGSRTAEWFESVLHRPVVLYVWLNDGYAYAARYAFTDTSETLAQCYNKAAAPNGQYDQVIAAGHVHGRGWLQTTGLPTPDLYLHIRGDTKTARIPAGVGYTDKRGPLPGTWYE